MPKVNRSAASSKQGIANVRAKPLMPQPLANSHTEFTGFFYRLRLKRGLIEQEARNFDQRLAEYLQQRLLITNGAPLMAWVGSREVAMCDEDRMDFLAWLVQDSAIAQVGLSRLCDADAALGGQPEMDVSYPTNDSALQATLVLYKLHRLTGSAALNVLNAGTPFKSRLTSA